MAFKVNALLCRYKQVKSKSVPNCFQQDAELLCNQLELCTSQAWMFSFKQRK
jgi:hypothetical protein